jgi:nitroreductase
MELREVIQLRRSLRSFARTEISDALLHHLAEAASLAPSCSNNQPWRFVFVRSPAGLEKVLPTLAPGNATWAKHASLVVVVWSKPELDCQTPDGRDYYQFDTGMATGFLMLAAAEKNLVTHPIAGFDPEAVRKVLGLDETAKVITLLVAGGRTAEISPELSDWQIKAEAQRPARLGFDAIASII